MNAQTEQRLNSFLQQTLKTSLYYEKKGKKELAKQIIVLGSSIANHMIDMGRKADMISGVNCPYCHQTFHDEGNIRCLDGTGMCASCDHIQTDLNCEDLMENARGEL